MALWVAARELGEGGRGGGFIACATSNGIVGTVAVELTASAKQPQRQLVYCLLAVLTAVVTFDC